MKQLLLLIPKVNGANVPDADEEEIAMEPVLHAPAGMVIAREVFGVRDPDILAAIRNHTLGNCNMSALEKLIFLADFIEPNRKSFDGLEAVRMLAEEDLTAAVKLSARLSNEYVVSRGGKINSRTARMLNDEND